MLPSDFYANLLNFEMRQEQQNSIECGSSVNVHIATTSTTRVEIVSAAMAVVVEKYLSIQEDRVQMVETKEDALSVKSAVSRDIW